MARKKKPAPVCILETVRLDWATLACVNDYTLITDIRAGEAGVRGLTREEAAHLIQERQLKRFEVKDNGDARLGWIWDTIQQTFLHTYSVEDFHAADLAKAPRTSKNKLRVTTRRRLAARRAGYKRDLYRDIDALFNEAPEPEEIEETL